MTTLTERVSCRGLDFVNQRRCFILRKDHRLSFQKIAGNVKTVQGRRPSWVTVCRIVKEFNARRGLKAHRFPTRWEEGRDGTLSLSFFILKGIAC